jgi:hypothetical protein
MIVSIAIPTDIDIKKFAAASHFPWT